MEGSYIKKSLKEGENTLTNKGALAVVSGKHTGRSPNGKFIVNDYVTENTVDWENNQSMSTQEWNSLLSSAEAYMAIHSDYGREFIKLTKSAGKVTGFSDKTERSFTFFCELPAQALFVSNMFGEVSDSSVKEAEVYCLPGLTQDPKVVINFSQKKIIISGTKYLGEIKKSVFTYMNYILTEEDVLPMHCSVNTDMQGENPAIFFGLSGTGKTTLSASPERILLGDDEHGWSNGAIFNIESGCYAKTIDLTLEREPEIFQACQRFGSILENVKIIKGEPDFADTKMTKNGRSSYPISFIENHVSSGFIDKNPKNIIMLTCDATGVLPAVSKMTPNQAKEMFLAGYTSKVAGTEMGVNEPQTVFSACFGAPFLPRKPTVYADMLHRLIGETNAKCWLVNTGWVGGPPGVGNRISLSVTRQIVDNIVTGKFEESVWTKHTDTGFAIPTSLPSCDFSTLPEDSWDNLESYRKKSRELMSKIEKRVRELL